LAGSENELAPYLTEACVEDLASAVYADRHGAGRLELCADLQHDGLTPSLELAASVLSAVSIPVRVMIRSRAGDFHYTAAEIEGMAGEIEKFKSLPVDGFVFGALDRENNVDIPATKMLVEAARPFHVTFHKAIDLTPDPVASAVLLSRLEGISGILTSGGAPTAEEGADVLRAMVQAVRGKVEIIACGKITAENLPVLHRHIQAPAYHGRRIV
jgi:copper homeostasis protein